MIKTYLITVFLLTGNMSVLASDVNAPVTSSANAGAVVNSTTNNVQATPPHDQTEHGHSEHDHKNHNKNKLKSKSQRSKKAHDHSKHDHKDHAKKSIPMAKPTDKEYPIGVVRWPVFVD